MLAYIGHACLIFSCILGVVQVLWPALYLFRAKKYPLKNPTSTANKQSQAWVVYLPDFIQAQFFLIITAMVILVFGFAVSDFSMELVFRSSHHSKPMLYKIAGAWGQHEGSMLLWVSILSGYMAWESWRYRNTVVQNLLLWVLSGILLLLLLFLWLTSNPFVRIEGLVPVEGQGFNPLLQDVGLAFHPPILYLGYVGYGVVFAYATVLFIKALQVKRQSNVSDQQVHGDSQFIHWCFVRMQSWALWSWAFLTIGIAWGSWWAYYELGWGGWWFWDPVENVSLLPWLVGVALLHGLTRCLGSSKNLSVTDIPLGVASLGVVAFNLSLMGTFLVRSGLLTSVHAFAVDPLRGVGMLVVLALVLLLSMLIILMNFLLPDRSGHDHRTLLVVHPLSRSGWIQFQIMLFCVVAGIVLWGTLYPLVHDVLHPLASDQQGVSVGTGFYYWTVVPLGFLAVAGMMMAPSQPSTSIKKKTFIRDMVWFLLLLCLGLLMSRFQIQQIWGWLGVVLGMGLLVHGLAMGVRVMAGQPKKRSWGMLLSHVGFAVSVFGMGASDLWKTEFLGDIRLGQGVRVGSYDIILKSMRPGLGPNYGIHQAELLIQNEKKQALGSLYPQKRYYPVEDIVTTESALLWRGLSIVYVSIGDQIQPDQWMIRVYVHPWVGCIWLGAIIMACGSWAVWWTHRRVVRQQYQSIQSPFGNHPLAELDQ